MEGVEVLRDEADKEQFDASVVLGKKEGKYYRWLRNEPRNLVLRKLDGYEICTDPDVRSALGPATRVKKGDDVDDTINYGDMILGECSMENHERLMSRDLAKVVRRTKGVMTSLKDKVRRAGGTPIEEHGLSARREGKGYDKGYTEADAKRELDATAEQVRE